MKPSFLPLNSRRLPAVLLFLFSLNAFLYAHDPAATKLKKTTFKNKDPFHTAAFIENKNLIDNKTNEKILYYVGHGDLAAFFTPGGVIYKVSTIDEEKIKERKKANEKEAGKEKEEEGLPVLANVIEMKWLGANPNPEVVAGEKEQGYYTYLAKVNKGYKTLTAYGYKTITYKNIYQGIDVIYSLPAGQAGIPETGLPTGWQSGMKYNIIVHPGADVSQIKMTYEGKSIKSLQKDADGNIIVETPCGKIMEQAPASFTEGNQLIQSRFDISGNTIQFTFPEGYNSAQTLTIDPWITAITSLPPTDQGFDVGYDYAGNTYIYGAGPTGVFDDADYFEAAKYDPNGNLLWAFNGSVPAIGWNSAYIPFDWNFASNIIVDKVSGKTYVGKGIDEGGTTTIRLNADGGWDNFVSDVDEDFLETWCFAYDCSSGSILAMGGGTVSDLNMGIINTTTAAVTTTNITGITTPSPIDGTYGQDILCGVYDNNGNLYVIMNSRRYPYELPYDNTIYKVNNTDNGYQWYANSGFTSFEETQNAPYWDNADDADENSNGFNALAANGNYLFYYDGKNVAAYNFANGNMAGNFYTIPGYDSIYQGGIAVDNCNNVYVGGEGVIKTFTFDGTNFNPGADISLGADYTGDNVHDVRYNPGNNLLYVTGDYFVGTFAATLSGSCPGTFTTAVSVTCSSATVHVSPQAGLSPDSFTYVWTDTLGNIISQTTNTSDTINTIQPGNGTFIVQVQWNSNCGGSALSDTVTIRNTFAHSNDTSVCAGQPVILWASAGGSSGTYSWSPGGSTDSSITVTPDTTTIYIVTYTPANCLPETATITITVHQAPTVSVNDTTICSGTSATLVATPSPPGGTYHWSVGGITTSSITVSPNSTTTYTVTYTNTCGSATAAGTITVTQSPVLTAISDTVCAGGTAQLTAIASISGGTYVWSPGNYTTGTISVSPESTTSYTVTYSTPGCNNVSATATAAISPPPTLSASSDTICAGTSGLISATPSVGGGTYSWAPTGSITSSITVSPATSTTYTVTYVLNGCNPVMATSNVTVTQPPNVSTAGTTICGGDTVVLTATPNPAGGTFLWLPGNFTTATISVTPATTTNYVVTYSLNGCSASDMATVTVNPQPVTTFTVKNASCATANGSITASASQGTGPYSYFWNNLPDESTPLDSGLAQGTYTVTVFDQNECSATASESISQSSAVSVVPTLSPFPCAQPPYVNVSLTATGGVLPYTYEIQGVDTNATGIFTNVPPGDYPYKVVDSTGCSAGGSITVLIHYNPDLFDIIGDSTSCYGLHDGSVMVIPVDTPNPAYTYSLNGGAPQSGTAFDSLGAANYQVVVYNGAGCTDTLNTTVYQPAPVTVTFPPPDTFFVTNGDTVTLSPIITNYVNPIYAWMPTSGLNCSNCASVTAAIYEPTVSPPIVYYVRVSDSLNLNCTAYDSVIIFIKGQFAMPDAFTPGVGGKNSLFGPVTYSYATIQEFHIYNRWGQLVHEGTNYWDGTFRGKEQPPGTYVYYIVVQYPNPLSPDMNITGKKEGSVVLLR